MTTRTTVRSWPAMGLAGVFLGGTSFVLFQDLLDGARPTTGHVLTALALIAATAAGHQIVTMFRARRLGIALGMAILTAASLAYVATMSGARNAEQSVLKAERTEADNTERERVMRLREQAQAMLETATAAAARECATGKGTKCDGRTTTRDVYAAAVAGHDAKLEKLGGSITPNAGYKAAAEAIVLLPWFADRKSADIERALIVLLPWLAVLIAELGTIVFLSSALGHRTIVTVADSRQTSFAGPVTHEATRLLASEGPESNPPKGGKRRTRPAHVPAPFATRLPANVIPLNGRGNTSLAGKHPVIAALEAAGKPLTNSELAKAMHVCGGESTKRRREVANLIDEWTIGKFVVIGLKDRPEVTARTTQT